MIDLSEALTRPQGLHLLTLVLGPLRVLQGWLVPLVVVLILGRDSGPLLSGIGFVLVGLVVTVGRRVVEVLRLRWWLGGDGLELRTGILRVETRTVPYERIQNVDLHQPLLPRVLGLAEVRIETAGAAGSDLTLSYVDAAVAEQLRRALSGRRAEARVDLPVPEVLVETSVGELLLAGATSNRVGALAVLVGAAWGWALDLGVDLAPLLDRLGELAGGGAGLIVVGAALALVVGLLVGWVASVVGTVVRFHGFRLTKEGDDLRRVHGLLARSSGVVPLRRVQAVRVDRAWLRRRFGYATLVADTAGSVAAGSGSGTGVVAPILAERRLEPLVSEIMPGGLLDEDRLEPVSPLALRRGFVRAGLVGVAVSIGLAFLDPRLALVLVPWAAGAWVWARARYRALGYRVDGEHLAARSGVLTRRTWLVPKAKVQSVATRESPFQRRLGLATLSIDTAGAGNRRVVVVDLDRELACRLADRLSQVSAATAFGSDGV